MIDQSSFRTCLEYREILRILQKSSALQDNFLWQSLSVGKNVVKIHHFEIDFVSRGLVIYFDGTRSKIDPKLPLFVKLDYRSSIFKISEFQATNNQISCHLPTEIKALEMRTNPRHKFREDQDKFVSLKPSLNASNLDMGNEIQVKVFDVSPYGLGLLISEQNRSYMKNNRILWVTKLQNMDLHYPILAEVVYISSEVDNRYSRRNKELKVGLKLSGVFPPRIYQDFLNN
ncbi:MAG: hypothetical protein ACJ76H_11385 [Bacteriovoracaceae bacterium]